MNFTRFPEVNLQGHIWLRKGKKSGFTVTDRRLFTEDGELRKDVPEEVAAAKGLGTTDSQRCSSERDYGACQFRGGISRERSTGLPDKTCPPPRPRPSSRRRPMLISKSSGDSGLAGRTQRAFRQRI